MALRRCYGCMNLVEEAVCPHCGYSIHQNNDSNQLPVGTLLKNQYLIGRVLGHGGFGITYIGWDVYLEMVVAIKEFYPSSAVNRDTTQSLSVRVNMADAAHHYEVSRERFLREAKTLAKLSNVPEIVGIQGYFTDNNTAYIIMEYVRGVDLRNYVLQRGGSIPAEEVFRLMEPVNRALEKVHAEGLVHRDISPDNIMLQPGGRAKLLDFGAVRDVGDSDADIDLSHSTEAILKHGFAPMEQYRSRGNLGPWTDEYGFCASMYYCMSGRVPPDAPSRAMDEAHPDWDSIPGLTPVQRAALERGMSMRAKERFCSMEALHRALYEGQMDNPGPIPGPGPMPEPDPEPVVKKKNRGGIVVLILLLLLVGAGAFWYFGGEYLPKEIRMETVVPQIEELLEDVGIPLPKREDTPPATETPEPAVTEAPEETVSDVPETEAPETEPPVQETEPSIPDSVITESNEPWNDNVLRKRPLAQLNAELASITTVTFKDTLEGAPHNAVDVSQAGNGSVLAWGKWSNGYHVTIAAEEGINGKDACAYLFSGCANLQSVDFGDSFHTDQATSMEYMFSGCRILASVNLEYLSTGNVTTMRSMFSGCTFSSLDLRHFDTRNVRDMSSMFSGCSLKTLQIDTWNTQSLEDMSSMFSGCDRLTTIGVDDWDVSKVTDMAYAFSDCNGLNKLDVSDWNVSRVEDFASTFYYCNSLTKLDVSEWNVSSARTMANMFGYCSTLDYLDVANWDVSNVTNVSGMFKACESLDPLELNTWDISRIRYYEGFMDNGSMINGAYWTYFFQNR